MDNVNSLPLRAEATFGLTRLGFWHSTGATGASCVSPSSPSPPFCAIIASRFGAIGVVFSSFRIVFLIVLLCFLEYPLLANALGEWSDSLSVPVPINVSTERHVSSISAISMLYRHEFSRALLL